MKRLLINLSFGLISLISLNSVKNQLVKAQTFSKSCLNYSHDLGINLKQKRSGSFQLLSTSIATIKNVNKKSKSSALREANLRAKLNVSKFIRLTNMPNNQIIKDINIPIIINGKIIKTYSQLKNMSNNFLIESSSSQIKGLRQIGMCEKDNDYVMVTLEITNDTIRAAKYMDGR